VLQLSNYCILYVWEKAAELLGLLDQGIKKLMLGNPLSEPFGQVDMMPAMPSFERRMLEFADAAGKTAL
jgi:hypothetical protein